MTVPGAGVGNCGEQVRGGDGLRNLELFRLEAERAGHAATAGVDELHLRAGPAQQSDFAAGSAEDRLVMAVAVDENLRTFQPVVGANVGGFGREKIGEEPGVFAQLLRTRIVGEKFGQLVLEDAGAAWLEKDEGHAGGNVRGHGIEYACKIRARVGEQAEVVERAAAADVPLRLWTSKACFGEHSFSGGKGLRMVVVVPRVRPQQDLMGDCGAVGFCASQVPKCEGPGAPGLRDRTK